MSVLALALLAALQAEPLLRVEPAEVGVGEPFEVSLRVPHGRGQRVEPGEGQGLPPGWQLAWVLLEGPRIERAEEATELSWSWMVLEPCEVPVPLPPVLLDGRPVEAEPVQLAVRGVLEPEEDAPRPPAPLRPVPPPLALRPWHVLALPLAVAGLSLLVWRLRRRPVAPEQGASPRRRLEGLADPARAERDAESRRAFAAELSALLRAAVDRRAGEARDALTVAEWIDLRRADGHLDEADVARIEPVLERCERMLYGGEAPTRLALERDLGAARELLDALERRDAAGQGGMS